MLYRVLAGCVLACLAYIPDPVQAADPEALEELEVLRRHCTAYLADAESREAALCAAYIQGYLAGVTRMAEVLRPVAAADSGSYADRALRTRAGGHLKRYHAWRHAGYCVGDEVSQAALIERVAAYLREHRAEAELTADQLLHRALTASFPCNGR